MNADSPLAAPPVGPAMDPTPRAARGADELALAVELTHVVHGWLAELGDPADGEVGSHRSVA